MRIDFPTDSFALPTLTLCFCLLAPSYWVLCCLCFMAPDISLSLFFCFLFVTASMYLKERVETDSSLRYQECLSKERLTSTFTLKRPYAFEQSLMGIKLVAPLSGAWVGIQMNLWIKPEAVVHESIKNNGKNSETKNKRTQPLYSLEHSFPFIQLLKLARRQSLIISPPASPALSPTHSQIISMLF